MSDTSIIRISKTSLKRLQKDIIDLIKNPLAEHGIYYAHDESNILQGYAVIFGPDDTIYRHGAYYFKFNFPSNYPFSPPTLTYLTNDGKTRFHPNLYRNGKVCISILNTWKGEQWTSCQTIRSVLLMLVTLFHNKPLLNEPGISEKHRAFIPYNQIITYRNIEIAILRTLMTGLRYDDPCRCFDSLYQKYILNNRQKVLDYVENIKKEASKFKWPDKDKRSLYISLYSMTCHFDYDDLFSKIKICLTKLK